MAGSPPEVEIGVVLPLDEPAPLLLPLLPGVVLPSLGGDSWLLLLLLLLALLLLPLLLVLLLVLLRAEALFDRTEGERLGAGRAAAISRR